MPLWARSALRHYLSHDCFFERKLSNRLRFHPITRKSARQLDDGIDNTFVLARRCVGLSEALLTCDRLSRGGTHRKLDRAESASVRCKNFSEARFWDQEISKDFYVRILGGRVTVKKCVPKEPSCAMSASGKFMRRLRPSTVAERGRTLRATNQPRN